MLRALVFTVMLCCANAAFAQTADIDGLSTYRLGMSREQAEAANPGRWGEIVARPINDLSSPGTPTGETAGPTMVFGGRSYSTRVVFRDDQLRVMIFEHVRRGPERECSRIFRDVLQELEQGWGPLTGAAPPWEMDGEEYQERSTSNGSRYREYTRGSGRAWRGRATGGENYRIQLRSLHIPPGRPGMCITTITIRDDFGLGPDFTPEEPPSLEQLAAAPFVENTQSVTLPGFENIHTLMPKFAEDEGIYGRAEMSCIVREDRTFWCRVTNETPPGIGFGLSALASIQYVRAAPVSEGGAPAGSRVTRRLTFADPRR